MTRFEKPLLIIFWTGFAVFALWSFIGDDNMKSLAMILFVASGYIMLALMYLTVIFVSILYGILAVGFVWTTITKYLKARK